MSDEIKLSVIIVSYNVRHFLEQCLYSVYRSAGHAHIPIEVFVVDNASADDTVRMVMEKYAKVKLFVNKENVGFSKANNQAIVKASGEYILLLNPDTVLQEDTLSKVLRFMDEHPDAGALGIRMVDGKGRYLPESKRGFPTPWNSFCKMFGLSSLFPKVKWFGGYYLSYLDPLKNHPVDVLSGAFMLIRSSVLEKVGLLDEDYFMYGEDIDLSYRIVQAGYKNYYFAESSIIHYKGESTKKGSFNYVRIFYQAMIIFIRKHLKGKQKNIFIFLIYCAIVFRASMSVLYRILERSLIPVLDFLALSFLLMLVSGQYAAWVKDNPDYFPKDLLFRFFPFYAVLNVVSLFLNGAYDPPVLLRRILRGILTAQILTLLIYALLPESLRFSRILIVISPLVALAWFALSRWIYHWTGLLKFYTGEYSWVKYVIVVGNEDEFERVKKILSNPSYKVRLLGFVSVKEEHCLHPECLGNVNLLKEIVRMFDADEIIFCPKDIPTDQIIQWMIRWSYLPIEIKIATPESAGIIGSSNVNKRGDLYLMEYNIFSRPENKRKKYLVDLGLAVMIWFCILYFIFTKKNIVQWYRASWQVLIGKKTWFGSPDPDIPWFKPAVFPVTDEEEPENYEKGRIRFMYYIKNYTPALDLLMLVEKLSMKDPFRVSKDVK